MLGMLVRLTADSDRELIHFQSTNCQSCGSQQDARLWQPVLFYWFSVNNKCWWKKNVFRKSTFSVEQAAQV